jgi:hypothetical protein
MSVFVCPQVSGAIHLLEAVIWNRDVKGAVSLHPRMLGGCVVRHEIQDHLDASLGQPLPEFCQRCIATQRLRDTVIGDRERRRSYVGGFPIRYEGLPLIN